jgi:hypothetical protein
LVIEMTDEETKRRIIAEGWATVERLRSDENKGANDDDVSTFFTEPVRDPRNRPSPRELKRRHLPKFDTPHAHPWIGIWDIDQRIERALQIEREFMREILARVIDNERAVMCESVGSRLAELIDSQFPDLVDGSLRKTRDELRDLKVEIARFTSVTEELRRALDNERARTASGDVIPLPQRRQAH